MAIIKYINNFNLIFIFSYYIALLELIKVHLLFQFILINYKITEILLYIIILK
jgi:hypothetical protein